MLTVDQIKENWDRLIQFISTAFDGDRKDNLLKMYNELDQRVAEAPASGKIFFHSAFPGGYLHHVLKVIELAPKYSDLWISSGGEKNYSDEELIFVALNHDLGKLGSLTDAYFMPTYENWKVKRGIRYEGNPAVEYMKTADNSLYFLQAYNIKVTENEYLGIKLHDGLYDESNKSYFISYSPTNKLRILPYIIHTADFYAMRLEYEEWRKSSDAQTFLHGQVDTNQFRTKTTPKKLAETLTKNTNVEDYNPDMFDKIFGSTDDGAETGDK